MSRKLLTFKGGRLKTRVSLDANGLNLSSKLYQLLKVLLVDFRKEMCVIYLKNMFFEILFFKKITDLMMFQH